MATHEYPGQLTPRQIVRLAAAISADNMAAIAEGYLDISYETIKNLQYEKRDQAQGFNREIIRFWAIKNAGLNQVNRLHRILTEAGRECSYLNPATVSEILGMKADWGMAGSTGPQISEVTEEEFLTLAEDLRPWTEQAMKIEVAPWIREYVVDMEELYSELKLEKVRNKPTGTETRTLKSYNEMFNKPDTVKQSDQFRHVSKAKGVVKKILIKGDPGIGKTTLIKKIAYDWATGTFTQFIIVFVVFLKLVKPGEAIENVIINQRPELEGMRTTKEKLSAILDAFGNRCLLILDGLDEHALGANEDVLKIVTGKKLLYCNVIITSRPHSTKEIEKHFQTVVRVNGFTRGEAEKFAFKILEDDRKVQDILNFSPVDFQKGVNLFNFPILLSFMCLLVREEDVDLSGKSLSSGEIYMRMVRCLYKKFTIRTGIEYDESEFIESLKKIGQLALKTLLSGELLMKRREVFEKVGNDAFNYGLLIGHEDCFLLLKDITADILVTFPHRSIHEFLGAFFFVLMLSKGESVESVLGVHCSKSIFMMNPLFLHFCLWLASSFQNLPVTGSPTAYDRLRAYALSRIDNEQLHLLNVSALYPALEFEQVHEMKDKVIVAFLKDLLANCKQTRHLVMSRYESIDWTLKALRHVLSKVKSIHVWSRWHNDICTISEPETSNDFVEITLHGSKKLKRACDDVLNAAALYAKKISLTLVLDQEEDPEVNLSKFLHKDLKRLRIICEQRSRFIIVRKTIPLCPSLTHLSLLGSDVCHSVLRGLSDSASCGLLPKLQRLSFAFSKIGCSIVPSWKMLASFEWSDAPINFENINRLPNLESLSSSAGHIRSPWQSVFPATLSQLTRLAVFDLSEAGNAMLMEILEAGALAKLKSLKLSSDSTSEPYPSMSLNSWNRPPLEYLALTKFNCLDLLNLPPFVLYELDISHCKGLSGSLSTLFGRGFPSLHTLILSDCELTMWDLRALIQSRKNGNLPELRTLDVCHNTNLCAIMNCKKPSERCYCHTKTGQEFLDDPSKSIYYLQELSISVCSKDEFIISAHWPRLEQLGIDCIFKTNTEKVMRAIAEAYEKSLLPSLQRVLLFVETDQTASLQMERLNKHGILVTVMKMEDRKFLQRSESRY